MRDTAAPDREPEPDPDTAVGERPRGGQAGDRNGDASPGGPRSGADGIVRGGGPGSAPVPLSVLDLATVGRGQTAADALGATTRIAALADRRGFHRLWVAEHHGMPAVASSAPAVVLAHVAAHTRRIRLGSGGVMLPNHAPLVVAEQFGTLQALAPGRVDLGLGRAPGTDGRTAAALRGSERVREAADQFPRSLDELTRFLDDTFPEGHPYAGVRSVPGPAQGNVGRPPIWLLGSSGFSAELAGRLGLPFSFAHHFAARGTLPALQLYREAFRPSAVLDRPYAKIAVNALAADDETEARRQVMTSALMMVWLGRGRLEPLPTPEEAEAYEFGPQERRIADGWMRDVIYGTADTVRSRIDELVDRTGADEVMVTSNVHGPQARLRSVELIADAYDLPDATTS